MIRVGQTWHFHQGGNGVPLLEPGWDTEAAWSWSRGTHGSLRLPVPPAPGELWLELRLGACTAPDRPSQSVSIAIDGEIVTDRPLAGHATITVPAPSTPAGTVRLTFLHAEPVTPALYGASSDRRSLGVALTQATGLRLPGALGLPAGPNRLVLEHSFGWGGTGNELLGDGWGPPEDGFAWAVGRRSVLHLPGRPGAHTLILHLWPFTDPDRLPSQRILIGVNEQLVATVALTQAAALGLHLPPLGARDSEWKITLEADEGAADRPFGVHSAGLPLVAMLLHLALIARGPERPTPPADWQPALSVPELLQRFETLGCTCDYGYLQRQHGAERLGLLHLTLIPIDRLVRGLLDTFRHLGRSDRLVVHERAHDPFAQIRDETYHAGTHTSFAAGQTSELPAKRQAARIYPFLRARFFAELADGRRLLILRRPETLIPEEVEAVLAALRLHGDAMVLWLEQEGVLPIGKVVRIGPRLLRGRLDWRPDRRGATETAWLSVLQNAWKLAGEWSGQTSRAS